jgi:hypothetical protein
MERFRHGFAHDIFLSYTHTDDQPDAGRRWVTQFLEDLRARLEIVSGHGIDIWRDQEKLGAADRFNDSIAQGIRDSALLLVILSPAYFNSSYCRQERETFYGDAARRPMPPPGKAAVIKVAKYRVPLDRYPPDLRELLEYRFYVESAGKVCKEFLLSEDPEVRARQASRVDDVAQKVAALLAALEPVSQTAETKGSVYLAETTSDLEPQRDELRRHLIQLGYEVEPKTELRLYPARDVERIVTETIRSCRMSVHPLGAYYGFVPEGAEGKSVIQMQLELSRRDGRNGDLPRVVWVPEGLIPQEDVQKKFLEKVRQEYAGRGFELLERPYRTLTALVEDRLKTQPAETQPGAAPSGTYLVCDNADRALAKSVRSFLFNQNLEVEWTPVALAATDLTGNPEHEKLLQRNGAHLVLHGATSELWLQDRIHELNRVRQAAGAAAPVQVIYLADPRRDDKDEILVRGIDLVEGYGPQTVGGALQPFVDRSPGGPRPPTDQATGAGA